MRFFSLLLFTPFALAQGDATNFGRGLVVALQQANLTGLMQAATGATALIPVLMAGGNKTLLAPSNEAFENFPKDVSSDVLLATLSYHAINQTIKLANVNSTNSIVPTFLKDSAVVQLPSGTAQPIVLAKGKDGKAAIVEPDRNVSFVGTTDGPVYENLQIQVIDQVLHIPLNLTTTFGQLGLRSLPQSLDTLNLTAPLQAIRSGLTVFAPVDSAFDDFVKNLNITSSASGPQFGVGNNTAVKRDTIEVITKVPMGLGPAINPRYDGRSLVLLNHIVNGSTIYSSDFSTAQPPLSGSGTTLTFGTGGSGTGMTVSSGSITANIIRSDVLASNAVIHLIDKILLPGTVDGALVPGGSADESDSDSSTPTSSVITGGTAGANISSTPIVVSSGANRSFKKPHNTTLSLVLLAALLVLL